MKFIERKLWIFGAILIGVIILLTLIIAPTNDKINSGSTYGRSANGYGAWYAFMSARGTPVKRWQKPFKDLVKDELFPSPIALLKVNSSSFAIENIDSQTEDWLNQGNNLVVLGNFNTVTKAPFKTIYQGGTESFKPLENPNLNESLKPIKIETTRRNSSAKEVILGDRFGAVVWQENVGKGKVIYATTPHLAANAYQDWQGNYEFLAKLVDLEGDRQTILVDEYLHGYKDVEVIKQENNQTILDYLIKTPLFPIFIQILVIFILIFLASLRRFGKPVTLVQPVVENSQAYIDALAGILQKAESTNFVVEAIAKEEQKQLQKVLGLGETLLDRQSLLTAWQQQSKRPTKELEDLLITLSSRNSLSRSKLLKWLDRWQEIKKSVGD
jgi:hypothetical protein